jgi:ornithine decarboxylase
MALCIKNGYSSNQILYANTMKSVLDIKEAPKYGINLTTVDSVEAVEQIIREANGKWMPNILVRLAVNDAESRSPFSIKFGALTEEWNKITDAIDYYKLPFKGVSFHVGSQAKPHAFSDAIKMCQNFASKTNKYLDTIDIGGGFLPDRETFIETTKYINKEKREWTKNTPRKWIAEPGRFFSGPIQTLYVPVVFAKENSKNIRYILDDSLYGQFTNIVFDHSEPRWYTVDKNLNKIVRKGTNKDALFFGKTCDSADFIGLEKSAPKYEIGDVLVFPNMGAYTNVTASNFNGFSEPKKIYTNKLLLNKIINNESIIFPMSLNSKVELSLEKNNEMQ